MTFPHASGILPYLLYSDRACVRLGGYSFHVLNIISAARSIAEARSRQGYGQLALLPIVPRKHLGLPKKMSTTDQEKCASCLACMTPTAPCLALYVLRKWLVMACAILLGDLYSLGSLQLCLIKKPAWRPVPDTAATPCKGMVLLGLCQGAPCEAACKGKPDTCPCTFKAGA